MNAQRPLDGQVAAITGGAGGIGVAIARRLAAEGARVFSLDLESTEAAQPIPCDVRNEDSVVSAFSRLAQLAGRLDILVHAAGVSRDAVVWKLSAEDWDLVQSVNLRGGFLAMRSAIPMMRETGGGRIVLVGSINGSRGKFGLSAYAASKAGLTGLTKSAAREAGRFGVTVNIVEPGMVRTAMTEALPEDVRAAALRETLLGSMTEPDDVAASIAFLCGPGGRRITGQVLRVDAGQFLGS
ncbi:MAG: SDR family oxidoreductase [Thermoanaerobaculia bacterium]|nr:SDR family oxidoreductase [Thermoanaerobaculia bacterium]